MAKEPSTPPTTDTPMITTKNFSQAASRPRVPTGSRPKPTKQMQATSSWAKISTITLTASSGGRPRTSGSRQMAKPSSTTASSPPANLASSLGVADR